jgi:hypothetical protein
MIMLRHFLNGVPAFGKLNIKNRIALGGLP